MREYNSDEKTDMSDALNLPFFTGDPLPPSLRSVDEIDQWIEEDYQHFFKREDYEKEKLKNSVNVPFSLAGPFTN